MASILAQQTIVGNIVKIYDKRTVGKDNNSVIDFTVAVTPRKNINGEWVDGETYWVSVTAWNRLADHLEESFRPGDGIVLIGHTDMKKGYEKDGKEYPARPIVIADFIGVDIARYPAHSERQPGKGSSSKSSSTSTSSTPKKTEAKQSVDDDIFGDDDLDFEAF
jgi:single-strand DNA-binding protein